jgi:hypothetical protein
MAPKLLTNARFGAWLGTSHGARAGVPSWAVGDIARREGAVAGGRVI